MLRKYRFEGVQGFKEVLMKEDERFAKAFTGHLLRFALARELAPSDSITIESIISKTKVNEFRLKSLIREVILNGIR